MNENTVQLPPAFLTRMEEMLGSEYSDFLASFDAPRTYGLRVNTSKINCRDFEKLTPFSIRSIPWIKKRLFLRGKMSVHPDVLIIRPVSTISRSQAP